MSAAVALGVGELVPGFSDTHQSLVVSVGNQVIEVSPEPVTRFGIDTFGRNDKPALLWGILGTSLAIVGLTSGAPRRTPPRSSPSFRRLRVVRGVGPASPPARDRPLGARVVARGRRRRDHAVAPAPPAQATRRPPLRRPVAATAPERPGHRHPSDPHAARRSFLAWAGAGPPSPAWLPAGSRAAGRAVAESQAGRGGAPRPRRRGTGGRRHRLDGEAEGLSPFVTPNADFYRIDTALSCPRSTRRRGGCSVNGMVDQPVRRSTFDELLALADGRGATSRCRASPTRSAATSSATPAGRACRSRDLLERGRRAGRRRPARRPLGRRLHRRLPHRGRPSTAATALVAVGMNGEPLPDRARLPRPARRRRASTATCRPPSG